MRLMIAEDSALLREGLVHLLADEGHEVAAAVGDADALLAAVAAGPPDVAVVDVRMPPSHTDEGLRAALRLRAEHPRVGVLVLSQYVEPRYAAELLTADTRGLGYLLKDRVARVEEFVSALERVNEGETVFDPEVVRRMLTRSRHADELGLLTDREQAVLALMAQGHTNTAIAGRLFVSTSAVEKYTNAVFDKLRLPRDSGTNRRVLAVLRFLGS
ncbi:two component transcriptional regulator, LuxR family [Streptomyces yunnanensis]|uniref:Two component transcriptional regulator, LuxR family n=2 Tax=Streptomyces yunnanensis TaxID=156453 RepID=A0A9X8MPZ2_9ACTN|nr:two component transcriptional regulator, LuxR family [Streptomyces yunnanensis]